MQSYDDYDDYDDYDEYGDYDAYEYSGYSAAATQDAKKQPVAVRRYVLSGRRRRALAGASIGVSGKNPWAVAGRAATQQE